MLKRTEGNAFRCIEHIDLGEELGVLCWDMNFIDAMLKMLEFENQRKDDADKFAEFLNESRAAFIGYTLYDSDILSRNNKLKETIKELDEKTQETYLELLENAWTRAFVLLEEHTSEIAKRFFAMKITFEDFHILHGIEASFMKLLLDPYTKFIKPREEEYDALAKAFKCNKKVLKARW